MSRRSVKSFFVSIMRSKNTEIILISIIIQLYIFRTSLPVFKYAFICLFPLVFIYFGYNNKNRILQRLRDTIGILKLVIILVIIFFLAFVFSGEFYEIILIDLINSIVLLALYYILILTLENKDQFNCFVHWFIYMVLVSAVFVIIFQWDSFFIFAQIQEDTSEVIDRNFALLPLFYSFFGIFYFHSKKHVSGMLNVVYSVFLVLFTLCVLMSGSRRGLILFFLSVIVLFMINAISLINNNLYIKRITNGSRYFLLFMIFASGLLYGFISLTSGRFKNKTLRFLGSENIQYTQRDITLKVLSYVSLLQTDIKYSELNDRIWTPEFDSRYPDSGWGSIYSKSVSPLHGQNVEIVPKDAEGACIEPSSIMNIDQQALHLKIKELEVTTNEKYTASIYCYVSEEFCEGDIRFMLGWVALNNDVVDHNPITYYDLEKKATWQKLNIEFDCKKGIVPIYLSIRGNNLKKLHEIGGHVIFAYPEIHKVGALELKDSITGDIFESNTETKVQTSLLNIGSFFQLYNINLFKSYTSDIKTKKNIVRKHDPNDVIHGRTNRWKFAWHLFKDEYSWSKKLFGGGFDYLTSYGSTFHKNPEREDWPHNPFLSVLLYSGILGLAFYLFVFYKAIYYYIKFIREYYIFFVFFAITFFFSFFSSNSPFTPPVMGFLLIFPFFLNAVLSKDLPQFDQES